MRQPEWQPPGTTHPGQEIDGAVPPDTTVVADCSGIRYALTEGSWLLFGRDDSLCSMPIWECVRFDELSRVAGVIWCLEDEVWVRNLSTSHELIVGGGASPQQLTPRREGRRGPACSVDPGGGWICAPSTGDWRIELAPAAARSTRDPAPKIDTLTIGRPPAHLLPTAVAMCEPLLRRGSRPATYQEIATSTGAKPRTARDRVDRLLQHYAAQGADRFLSRLDPDESHYGPLARLLVYRSIVTHDDLVVLEGARR